jgi:hypothetical protein
MTDSDLIADYLSRNPARQFPAGLSGLRASDILDHFEDDSELDNSTLIHLARHADSFSSLFA